RVLSIENAPSISNRGQYAVWIFDGEVAPADATEIHIMKGAGGIFNLGWGARCLPCNNVEVPGSCPCPVTFSIGRTSKDLGNNSSATLCLNKKPGFSKS